MAKKSGYCHIFHIINLIVLRLKLIDIINFIISKILYLWIKKRDTNHFVSLGAEDRNRTGTVSLPQDFKSCASACSATSAYLVAEIGLEPTTPRVWTECSSQLSYSAMFWLRGQDLNLRPSGYEPDELPTAPPREKNGGWNRIRTYVGVSRQIYSLLPLTTRASIHNWS